MEMIEENKFRIALFALCFVTGAGLMVSYSFLNQGQTLWATLSQPGNWIISFLIGALFVLSGVIGAYIWNQGEIRDRIETQSLIKIELENVAAMKELKFDVDEEKLSNEIRKLIKKKHEEGKK